MTHLRSNMTLFRFSLIAVVCVFLSLISIHAVFSENNNMSISSNSKNISDVNRTVIDLVQDPFFRFIGKDANLTTYWKDPNNSCSRLFTCNLNLTDRWVDNQSYQLSTTNGTENTWSWIAGKKVEVSANQQYELLTHMKLNPLARQSHIGLWGFNESSQQWYQIIQCPSGNNGPLEWKEFDCKITIPQNVTKIYPVLNAGWSSRDGEKATTSFDAVHVYRIPSSDNSSSFWLRGTNMPTPRTDFTGASLNEKIYVIGGFDSKGKTIDTVEYYDPKIDTWSTASPLPEPLDHAAAAVYNGTLYVVGGFARANLTSDQNPSDRLFIYNPSSDKWDEGKSMPKERGALTANFINGTLYAVGGVDDSGVSVNNTAAYDPNTDKWTERAPMPTARDHFTSSVVNGKLYVIGGRVGDLDHNLDANQVYDPISNSWSLLESMPSKRGGIASAALDKTIYVFGGEGPDGTFNNNEKYHPGTDKWSEGLPMPTSRHGLIAAVINNKIYVIGGGQEPGLNVSGFNDILQID
jgi:N-acetylneuraminic acid mutarotase